MQIDTFYFCFFFFSYWFDQSQRKKRKKKAKFYCFCHLALCAPSRWWDPHAVLGAPGTAPPHCSHFGEHPEHHPAGCSSSLWASHGVLLKHPKNPSPLPKNMKCLFWGQFILAQNRVRRKKKSYHGLETVRAQIVFQACLKWAKWSLAGSSWGSSALLFAGDCFWALPVLQLPSLLLHVSLCVAAPCLRCAHCCAVQVPACPTETSPWPLGSSSPHKVPASPTFLLQAPQLCYLSSYLEYLYSKYLANAFDSTDEIFHPNL